MCYYFDAIFKLDFDINNILINEKPHKNILIYDITYKTLIGAKPLVWGVDGVYALWWGVSVKLMSMRSVF